MSGFDNTSEMHVTKRNGKKEIISFDKILQRIKKVGRETNIQINFTSLVIKIIDQLYDGIPTDKIDEISAEQCATMSSIHYDYGTLASRLIVSNHHRNTSDSFSKTMKKLYSEHLLHDDFIHNVNLNAKQLDAMCDYSRDNLIDYFGFKTLERSYLMSVKRKIYERPQMMFMRLAVAIHGTDLARIAETYYAFSTKQMIHGTPSLYNAGTKRSQMSSCFARGTLVHTIGGPVPIEDMQPGYKVVTHTGQVRDVTQLHINRLGDHRTLMTVNFYQTRPITVTSDHRLWIYNRSSDSAGWKAVEELTTDDYVMVPKNRKLVFVQDDINMKKLAVDSEINKFFGIWIRYGAYLHYQDPSRNEQENGEAAGIQIVLPSKCEKAIAFCWGMNRMFGDVRMDKSDYDIGEGFTVIRYMSKEMAKDYESWFGKDRRIPSHVYQFPTHWVRAFLSGWNVTELPLTEADIPSDIYTLCRIHELNYLTFFPLNYTECDEVVEREEETDGEKVTQLYVQFSSMEVAPGYAPIQSLEGGGLTVSWGEGEGAEPPEPETVVHVDASGAITGPDTEVFTLGVEEDHSYSIGGIMAENCYLISMESDSIEGIYNTLKDCAMISKYAGGIGLHIHNVRATGSHIAGTNGTSNGIVPMLRVFNHTAKYVDQCVHPSTTIFTTRGPQCIRDVVSGETSIFGMGGQAEVVTNVLEHSYTGNIHIVETKYGVDPLWITPEHPVFALDLHRIEEFAARNLSVGVAGNEAGGWNLVEPTWIDAKDLQVGDQCAIPIPSYAHDIAEIHDSDCYMYGLLLANGAFLDTDQHHITCRMRTYSPHVYDAVSNYLNSNCVEYRVQCIVQPDGRYDENAHEFLWNRPIHLPFRWNDLYDEHRRRRFSPRWLHLPIEKSKYILKGMVDALGDIDKEITLSYLSKTWAESFRYLCLRMGVLTRSTMERMRTHSLTKSDHYDESPSSNSSQVSVYTLYIPPTVEICELLELEHDGRDAPFMRKDTWLFSPITSIETVEYQGPVYDLQMTQQHDYLLGNMLVHNGGGKRNGSIAIYMEPWHADIELFLQMRKNHGEEELKARDLFYALWVPDLFMKRVKENGKWTLFCPHECPGLADVHNAEFELLYTQYEEAGRGRGTTNARDLWFKILDAQMETGTPYLVFKDAANRKSNQQNLGTIKSSNLCVAPETKILTDRGHLEIQTLKDQEVQVWNGQEFSPVTVRQTGVDQELVEVHTNDGCVLTCTQYHKFFIQNKYSRRGETPKIETIEAQHLQMGDKITKCEYPVVDGTEKMLYPYTHGFFCGDGTYTNVFDNQTRCEYKCLEGHSYCKRHIDFETENSDVTCDDSVRCNGMSRTKKPICYLYGEKKKLLEHMDYRSQTENGNRFVIHLPLDMEEKYNVPMNHTVQTKMDWLSGYCDADGSIAKNGDTRQLQMSSINQEFLMNVKFMLQTCGINPKMAKCREEGVHSLPDGKGGQQDYATKELYRLNITFDDLLHLVQLGFSPKRLKIDVTTTPNRRANHFVKITKVVNNGRRDNTFCFTEPLRNAGIFNGMLTSQCSEIIEYSDEHETAVCNLGSIALPAFVVVDPSGVAPPRYDFDELHRVSRMMTYNLNRIIDINYYPTPKTERSNMRHRPIGIGIQGLADTFMMMGMAFGSPESRRLNQEMFETIYHAGLVESCELAKTEGAYETFPGSPASEGRLQFDLWDRTEPLRDASGAYRYDWDTLRAEICKHGMRNSLLLAPMPTASTSQILGYNECIEPITSNIYSRRTLAGEFIVTNKYLMKDLISRGLWNEKIKNHIIANNGSIQGMDILPADLLEKYRTVWEIPMRTLIDMAAERGVYIDQSQSLNLWMEDPTYNSLTSMHFYSWSKGLKTGIYYLRRRAKHQAQQFTIEPEKAQNDIPEEDEICEMCSG